MADATCAVDGCKKKAHHRGWCPMHYERWRTHGDVHYERPRQAATCTVAGCGAATKNLSMCAKHYQRFRKYGDPNRLVRPTGPAPCAVEGCENMRDSRGWCKMHYTRWLRDGAPGEPGRRDDHVGCKIEGCNNPHQGLGYCRLHYERVYKHGDPMYALRRDGERNPSWRGDDVKYGGVHQRLRMQRGSASSHGCDRCDAPARQWAYDHTDPDERITEDGMPYSIDVQHYIPLCIACHREFDDAPVGVRGRRPRRSTR